MVLSRETITAEKSARAMPADKVDALAGAEESVAVTTGSAVACWWLCGKLGVCRDQRKVADEKLAYAKARRASFARRHQRIAGGWARIVRALQATLFAYDIYTDWELYSTVSSVGGSSPAMIRPWLVPR